MHGRIMLISSAKYSTWASSLKPSFLKRYSKSKRRIEFTLRRYRGLGEFY